MSLHRAGSPASDTKDAKDVEQQETRPEVLAGANNGIKSADAELYEEALARYGVEGNIDPAEEKRVRRKLDRIIIPVLGVSYFYYYVDKTTLSYAAIFVSGPLGGEEARLTDRESRRISISGKPITTGKPPPISAKMLTPQAQLVCRPPVCRRQQLTLSIFYFGWLIFAM